ncbi:MAG: spore coat protein [Tenericutes bacterium]|jgi:spore coat protein CotF|nr:spore coat protein [Mycoplasmatota bacterium]
MQEKLIISNILTLQKNLIEILVHGVIESSTNNVTDLLRTQLNDNLEMQNKIFKFMESHGWYNIENAPEHKIQAAINKLNSN